MSLPEVLLWQVLRKRPAGRNGYKVVRIAAVDVLSDLDAVVRQIIAYAAVESPLHHPADGPPPLEGMI